MEPVISHPQQAVLENEGRSHGGHPRAGWMASEGREAPMAKSGTESGCWGIGVAG